MDQLFWFKRIKLKKIMKDNIVKDKSFELARKIVFLYQYLTREKHEYVLSKQVLRSGTSVGANISEGTAGQSKKDFCNRLSIAYKESRETEFWLKLLCSTGYLTSEKASAAMKYCDEVIRILNSILKTASQPVQP
jgi:four helix bundle protein